MNNDSRNIYVNDRVLVFDHRLFIDDIKTPLSFTMRPATVTCRYGYKSIHDYSEYDDYGRKYESIQTHIYPDLVDVVFDHRPEQISKGHFTTGVIALGEPNEIHYL